MNQPKITFIINEIPYALTSTNVEAIKEMPSADRQQLMALLEAIKREENAAQPSPVKAASAQSPARKNIDPDALMAQLAMEDKPNQEPELTKQSLYTMGDRNFCQYYCVDTCFLTPLSIGQKIFPPSPFISDNLQK